MKKLLSLALVLTFVLASFAMLAVSSSAEIETTTVVEKGSEWEYLAYEDKATTAPEGWMTGDDSATWEKGNAPFSSDPYTWSGAQTIIPFGESYIAFIRQEFTIEDASTLVGASISVKYDEYPVVYINGTQVWSAEAHFDSSYFTVDLSEYLSAFVTGTNTIAVKYENVWGGSGMDLSLEIKSGDAEAVNSDGTVTIVSTESYNAAGEPKENPWGALGAVANLYDGRNDSVWGWGEENIFIVANFMKKVKVTEIYLETKDEGSMAGSTDPHGEYTIYYKDDNGEWIELGKADALIEGKTVTADIETSAIKVQVSSWYNSNWKSIAELSVKGAEIADAPEGPTNVTISPYDPEGLNGFENWSDQTQLLICTTEEVPVAYTWKLSIRNDATGETKTISMACSSSYADWLRRFEVCLGEGENQFIPENGASYTISAEIYNEAGELVMVADEADGFICGLDPIVPETPVDPEPPVDPVDPPVTGDATAIIAVLAVVALFGAAVVTKKAFVK